MTVITLIALMVVEKRISSEFWEVKQERWNGPKRTDTRPVLTGS